MSVRTLQRSDGAVFFCTFTCWAWLPLFQLTNSYDRLYTWMHLARGKGFRTLGYVIMPNHVHLLLLAPSGPSINALLANAKRFLAYDIINRLSEKGELDMLTQLQEAVRPSDRARGQAHRVFTTSSDIRECFDEAMIEQKLHYMHANPVSGKWSLVDNAIDYPHSSMAFYLRDSDSPAPIERYDVVWHKVTRTQGPGGGDLREEKVSPFASAAPSTVSKEPPLSAVLPTLVIVVPGAKVAVSCTG
ncbi:MAG: hypothetical protein IPO90_14785 [Flavobacteriales bacterium]|nr:hypothetical protein [Flavobacteriales bacterium]